MHNGVCAKSNRRENITSDKTVDLNWAPHTLLQQPVPALARGGKSVTSLTRANCPLQQASSAKTLQVFDLSASVNEIYKSE